MKELKRNDPCHCGSGKKYKKCCMAKDEDTEKEQARQNYLKPLMDIGENEGMAKFFNDEFFDSLNYDDVDDEFDEDEEYINSDEYPELSDEDINLVNEWWAKYLECEDALAERQHLEDFIIARPDLVIYLDLYMEVLFELGAGYLKLGKIDDHIEFMMRFRKEFPAVYIKSFGHFDSDIIVWLISKNRTSEIPEYLNYFLENPVAFVDKLFEVVQILNAKDLTDELLHLVGKVYEDVCTSDDILGSHEILIPLIAAKYAAYLKPDFSDADIEKLIAELKEIKVEINPDHFDPSFWTLTFIKIYKPYIEWVIPKSLTKQKRAELHYDMRLNYIRFLKEKTGISWIAAHYYSLMLTEYLFTWHTETKNIKNSLWDFSTKTMDEIISALTCSFVIYYDATKIAAIYNAIYYFADYLLQCGNMDQDQTSVIQQDCIKGYDKAQSKLKYQNIFALAFKNFPEWD